MFGTESNAMFCPGKQRLQAEMMRRSEDDRLALKSSHQRRDLPRAA